MSPRLQRIARIVVPVLVIVAGLLVTRTIGDEPTDDTVATADSSAAGTTADTPISTTTSPADEPGSSASPSSDTTGATVDTCVDGEVDTVSADDLPPEAITTLELIASDGPFPYDQDGAVFQNREGVLPDHERGYYHEYTVETPGSDDRGARRIVVGDCGDRWYTDDHYDSFSLIEGEP